MSVIESVAEWHSSS